MDSNLPKKVDEIAVALPSTNLGKKILIFGRANCPDCARVKGALSENAIEFEYIDLDLDKQAQKWIAGIVASLPIVVLLDGSLLYCPTNEELLWSVKEKAISGGVKVPEPTVFDCIIVGAGPAGIAASVYAVRKGLKVLVISKDIGGQAARSGDIENYPGFTMITGVDLSARFREELINFKDEGLWLKDSSVVKGIEGTEGNFLVITDSGQYRARTIIIASGRIPRMLGIPGENEFFGRGVATCATCDAPLFRGRDVVVVGGGNSALDAAQALMRLAKSVVIVNISDELKGDKLMLDSISKSGNVRVLNNSEVSVIKGGKVVTSIVAKDKTTGVDSEIKTDGVFIEIGWTPSIDFLPPQVERNDKTEIVVDEFGKTSFDGIWAAGDVNNLWGEQVVIAAGEGAKTALSVAEHIYKLPHQATSNVHEG